MLASTASQTLFSIGYDFHLGSGDNGNVFGITNNKDATRNQTFTYDQLNRLVSAQNAGTDCNVTVLGGKKKFWGNNYGYDAWGNLLSKTVTKCSSEALSVVAGNDNRLQGVSIAEDEFTQLLGIPAEAGRQSISLYQKANWRATRQEFLRPTHGRSGFGFCP
jgi:hypothetical protein